MSVARYKKRELVIEYKASFPASPRSGDSVGWSCWSRMTSGRLASATYSLKAWPSPPSPATESEQAQITPTPGGLIDGRSDATKIAGAVARQCGPDPWRLARERAGAQLGSATPAAR